LNRTRQTLEIFKRCAGDFSEVEPQIFRPNAAAETERGMTLWSGVCNTAEHRGEDMLEAALTKAPEISNEIAKDGASAFKQWLTGLPDSSQVLVVGHSPFLELIVFGLLNIKIPALQPCDGFRLIEVNGELKYQPL
jgi:phosphohistidine phosphatase SixA